MKPGTRRFTQNTLLLLGSLLFILFLAELYFRILDPQSLRLSRPDPVLGWVHVPNSRGVWRKSCFSSALRFNSQGMRDIEHAIVKPEGTYRIAVIGDSYVTAHEVDFEDTFFRRLQGILRDAGHDVEVLGFGVRGFGTDQEYQLLVHYVLKYEPDLVVLAFVRNDIRNNSQALERNPAKPYLEMSSEGTLVARPFTPMPDHSGSWKSVLYKNSHLVRFLYFRMAEVSWIHNALVRLGIYANYIDVPATPDDLSNNNVYRDPPWPARWEEAWQLTCAILLQFRQRTENAGARFILFPVTHPLQVSEEYFNWLRNEHPGMALDSNNPQRRLEAFAREHDIDYLSALPAMRELQAAGKNVHLSCDGHWSREAHRHAAQLLAGYLLDRGYLPQ